MGFRFRKKLEKRNVKKFLIFVSCCILFCTLLAVCRCTGEDGVQENKLEPVISDAMDYETLKGYYSKKREVSLNDAEETLEQMGLTKENGETYRVVTQIIQSNSDCKLFAEFYLKTLESQESWSVEKIQASALFCNIGQEDGVFLGDFTCWLRGQKYIEYSLNGDVYLMQGMQNNVVCDREVEVDMISLSFYITKDVKEETIGYVYIHQTLALW